MKKIRPILYPISLIIMLSMLILSTTATIFGVLGFSLTIDESKYFTVVDENYHEYKCYTIEDHQVTVKINNVDTTCDTIAIGWLSYTGSGNCPTSITVPETLTYSVTDEETHITTSTTYVVAAICKGGFRNTSFSTINLPDTIEEMRQESFAYCMKLSSFTIPYQVKEIAPSTFLDCRALVSIGYRAQEGNSIVDSIYNHTITRIGDHAFDSCVSLISFTCPDSLLYFEKSCFQNCTSLGKFDFPGDPGFSIYQMGSGQSPTWERATHSYVTGAGNPVLPAATGTVDGDFYIDITTPNSLKLYKYSVDENEDASWVSLTKQQGSENPIDAAVTGQSGAYYIATNYLTIEDFAFADCSALTVCYFEENLIRGTISPHAFATSNANIVFNFASDNASPSNQVSLCDSSNSNWRDMHIHNDNQIIPITFVTKKYADGNYEGLSYTIKPAGTQIILDSAYNEAKQKYTSNTPLVLETSQYRYAEITGFDYPTATINGYCVKDNNNKWALTIPDRVKDPGNPNGEPNPNNLDSLKGTSLVKVIGANAFKDKTNIKTVKFKNGLVQIAHRAFWHCNGLTGGESVALDFSSCNTLREISYKTFYDANAGMSSVTGLSLPVNVEYLGDYAFAGFGKVTSFTLNTPHLKVIGERAFFGLGKDCSSGTANVILPNTLNDQDAAAADYYHPEKGQTYAIPCALGRHCFDTANVLATVTMADATASQKYKTDQNQQQVPNTDYTCSLGTSTFVRCKNLVRVVTSDNLGTIGASCFKSEGSTEYGLKEVFLTTEKSNALGFDYPWGISNLKNGIGDPIFVGAAPRSDFVVYVNGSLPGNLASPTSEKWCNERGTQYPNELETSGSRSSIPLFINIDWQSSDGVFYWKPGVSGNNQFVEAPDLIADYDAGVITIVKEKKADSNDDDKYLIARYFGQSKINNNVVNDIDLSKIPNGNVTAGMTSAMSEGDISNHLITIGDEAFGNLNSLNKGRSIILPPCVETISERAFYRKNGSYGVQKITYRNASGNILDSSGSSTFADDNAFKNSGTNFCTLPSSVKYIGRNAFYNNLFTSVYINISSSAAAGKNGFFIGNSAFYRNAGASLIATFNLVDNRASADFSMGTGTSAGGLYYSYTSSNNTYKILVYQAGATTGAVTVAANTVAIGMHAFSNSKCTSIELPSSVKTIYGGAFQCSTTDVGPTTIIGGEGLEYISAMEPKPNNYQGTWLYTSIWNSSMPFDITDWWDLVDKSHEHQAAATAAFKNCQRLTTINLKGMTQLKKIGKEAFCDCISLSVTSQTYNSSTDQYEADSFNYCTYDASSHTVSSATTVNSGVLYLAENNNIKSISAGAFNNCYFDYVHLPDPQTDRTKVSGYYVGKNPDAIASANGVGVGDKDVEGSSFDRTNSSPIKTTKILVGGTIHQANNNINSCKSGQQLSPGTYYNPTFANTTKGTNEVYYHIDYPIVYNDNWANNEQSKYRDLDETVASGTTMKYWIKIGNNYILFANLGEATDFCENINTIYPDTAATNYNNITPGN